MKVDEFIRKYNSAKDKDKFLNDIITTQYIPYHEKMTDCEMIILSTTKIDNEFRINSPMRFMLFVTTLLSRYTEIGKDENILTVFETLDEAGLIDQIVSRIPEKEYASYNTILNMELDDYMENNRSITAYISNKVKELEIPFKTLMETISNNVPQDVLEVAT
jgi:hypothetical protein